MIRNHCLLTERYYRLHLSELVRLSDAAMTAIPTLLNICLEFVSDNPCSLSSSSPVEPTSASCEVEVSRSSYNQYLSDNIVFRSDIFFPENIAEKLITLLSRKGKLNDGTMKLFVRETTRLKRVDIPNASEISKKGLLSIKDHKLVEIGVFSLKLPMNDVVECLSAYNLENLQSLSVSRFPPREEFDDLT